ncbi:MAG: c-type cytochrome [Hyphomicrobiales bacterium]|nr:c-type cytochrome [Hyphomicrobiales bacterium]
MRAGLSGVAAAAAFASLIAASPVWAADDPKVIAYGQHLAGECTSCHRIDGTDNGIPSIIGWDRSEFTATMAFYRDGQRKNPAMQSVAQSLDDEQIAALAAYFGGIEKPRRRR